jgi:hypothetical protein
MRERQERKGARRQRADGALSLFPPGDRVGGDAEGQRQLELG